MSVLYIRDSSPRASVKCRFGPLSANLDLLIRFLVPYESFEVILKK